MDSPRSPGRLVLALLLWVTVSHSVSRAEITVGIDAESLNQLLPAMTVREVLVPLGEGRSLRVQLDDLRVTGFDPAAGATGHVLTSVRLRVPQLGLDRILTPRLSLRVAERDATRELELSFEEATLALPLAGSIDLAALLPPIRFPADGIFQLAGAEGNVDVESKLSGISMGVKVLRFGLELKALTPAAPAGR